MTAKERVLKVYPDALAFRSMMMEGFFYIACSSEGRISERCRTEEAAWQNAAESLPTKVEQKVVYDAWGKAGRLQPVVAVEANEKEPKIGDVWETPHGVLYRVQGFAGDSVTLWCKDDATVGQVRRSLMADWKYCGNVAEPTPSTMAERINSLWTGKETLPCGCPANSEYIYFNPETRHAHCVKCGDAYKHESQLKPQPDSSSISTEQTFEETYEDWAGSSICEQSWIEAAMVAVEALESIKRSLYAMPPSQYGMMCTAIRRIQPLWETELRRREAWNSAKGQSDGR